MPSPSIGVITAGGIARTYDGVIIDLMGLNNLFIAHYCGDRKGYKNHAAFEMQAFYDINPDILIASPTSPPETNNFDNWVLKGLLIDPRFTDNWRYGILSRAGSAAKSNRAFFRKTYLNNIEHTASLSFVDTMIWSNRWVEVDVLP